MATKTRQKTVPVRAEPPPPAQPRHLARFWGSFFLCLVVLGLIAGLMLAGLFMLMGFHVL
jgi:predicted lipid-binding transport protein (Tim44 family)